MPRGRHWMSDTQKDKVTSCIPRHEIGGTQRYHIRARGRVHVYPGSAHACSNVDKVYLLHARRVKVSSKELKTKTLAGTTVGGLRIPFLGVFLIQTLRVLFGREPSLI